MGEPSALRRIVAELRIVAEELRIVAEELHIAAVAEGNSAAD